jgi:hypothetical protein
MKTKIASLSLALTMFTGAPALAQETPIDVNKNSGCGCCLGWMDHLADAGFSPTGEDLSANALMDLKLENGVPEDMVSCHTALIDGYVIEGHVPAADIRRLLSERPDAIGLAVPGMPYGSPGMGPESDRQAYDVFVINKDGSTAVFTNYPAS